MENPKSEIRNPKSGEAGFTLAMVIMVVAVMAVMMTVAVQTVEFQMKREREAELIFRGQQYVEGIRLYRQKYGRYPMRMKELWEANPKVLRRKWTDPITGSEDWGLIFQGEEGQELGGARPGGRGRGPGAGNRDQTGSDTDGPDRSDFGGSDRDPRSGEGGFDDGEGGFGRSRGEGERVGPIVGVHSLSTKSSIKVYEGRTRYDEWKFVLKEDQAAGDQQPQTPWGMPSPGPQPPGGGPGGPGGPGGSGGPGGPGEGGGSGDPDNRQPTPPWPPRPQPTGTPRY